MQTVEGTRTVRVWDPFVRIFHWSLVALFTLAYLTGEEETALHTYAGYGVLALLAARLVWGFVGTRHARFRDFVYGPRAVLAYARSLLAGRPRHYLGHNPLGGMMIFALLASLTVTGASGYLLLDAERAGDPSVPQLSMSPIAAAVADDRARGPRAEALEDIHEVAANFSVVLVVLHIAGVLVASLLHRENLVGAMISGNKRS